MAATEEQPEVETGPEEEAPPGGFKQRLPIVAAIIVGLAIGAGSGAAVIGPVVVRKLHLVATPKSDSVAAADSAAAEAAAETGGKPGEKGAANAPAVQLIENLVLNPAGSGGSRFLLLSVAIECTNAKGVEELQSRDAEVRDIILTTLGTKTVEQLSDVSMRDGLKNEITTAIGERIGAKRVKRLYFPQFVVQ